MAKRIPYIPNRVIDTNGISDGATISVYQTGSTTPVSIFADEALTVPLSNPYTVAAGAAVPSIYHGEAGQIRVLVEEDGGAVVSDDDPFTSPVSDADLGKLRVVSGGGVSFFDSIDDALAAGGDIQGNGGEYELSADVEALAVNTIRNLTITAPAGQRRTYTVGGSEDLATTITFAQDALAPGAREIEYVTLSGPLSAGDWIAMEGHLPGAWTDASSRNVQVRALMQVREVDTSGKIIKFRQTFPWGLDAQTVNATLYGISGQKVTPKENLEIESLLLANVSVIAKYIIGSTIDVSHVAREDDGTGLSVQFATDCKFIDSSRNRNTLSDAHNVLLDGLYACEGDIRLCATNPVANAAKGLRGKSWTACDIRLTVADAGFHAAVIQGIIGGRVTVTDSSSGTYNIDNGVTTANRNDCIHLEYARCAFLDVVSTQTDCTAVEFFGAIESHCRAFVTRHRSAPTANSTGVISVKGICIKSTFHLGYRGENDNLAIPVQVEYSDNEVIGGGFQRANTFHLDIISDANVGFYNRFPGALTGIDTETKVFGNVEAKNAIICDPEIGGFTFKNMVLHTNATTSGNHALILSSAGNVVEDCCFTGTSIAGDRRAVTSPLFGNIVRNCTSDGGYFYEDADLSTGFDLKNYTNLAGAPLFCEDGAGPDIQFHWLPEGGWAISGVSESLDGTTGRPKLDLTEGVWASGDILLKYQPALGEVGWRFDGTSWFRVGAREYSGFNATDPASIAAGATSPLVITVTGAQVGDSVAEFWADAAIGALNWSGEVTAADTVTITLHNPTASPVDPPSTSYRCTVKALTRI